jgi:hypothetical protein
VILGEILFRGSSWSVHAHLLVQAIIKYEVVCNCEPVWFHGMPCTKVKIAHIVVIEVRNFGLVGIVDDSGSCVYHLLCLFCAALR